MYPPLYTVCAANPGVIDVLGAEPRLYPAGTAPDKPVAPYAVFTVISGSPENYLDGAPDVDDWSVQIDVFAATLTSARDVAKAMRNAIEPVAYISRWGGEGQDPETKHYAYSFDVDWMHER